MTSLSAKTVQMLDILVGSPERARSAICCWVMPRRSAMIFQKAPRAGGALVVHGKLGHAAAFKLNDLGVLAAHVDHGTVVTNRSTAPVPWQVISVTTLCA